MLPLLDIFMVVLFVFATIQEGKLDNTTQEFTEQAAKLKETSAALESVEKTLEDARIDEKRNQLEKTTKALDVERERNMEVSEALEKTQSEVKELEASSQESEAKLKELEQNAKEQLKKSFESDDQYREQDIMDKLLDQNSVFEVELSGELNAEMGVINHCCFRADPRKGSWSPCAEVPAIAAEREQWFKSGGAGLLSALRQTKGGNAMTIIRQDSVATHQIGAKVEALIRDNVPEQKVYNEGISLVAMTHCGALTAPESP